MNKKTALFALFILAGTCGYSQKFVLTSLWRDSVITVDGNATDWDLPFRFFDSKSKLQYEVVNDDKYIYVSVRTSDDKAQMKIMRAGMDLTFDVSGKKKEVCTVHFPLKNEPRLDMNPDPNDMDQQVVEKPDVKKMKLDWVSSEKEVRTQGFKNVPASFYSEADSGKYGIQAAVNWDRNDVMTYELKVPFSAFYKEVLTATDTVKPITIGIKANAMDLPMIPTSPNADATGQPGSAGSMNPNGMSNGMPTAMNNNNTRPQTSSPQPVLAIPKAVADMGMPLIVSVKIRLAFR